MPTRDEHDPALLESLRELLARQQPAYELIAVESDRPPAPPPPPGADRHDDHPLFRQSPPLATLQEHYRNLNFRGPDLRLPDAQAQADDAHLRPDADLVRCRVRPRDAAPGTPESIVTVSLRDGRIISE